MIISLVFDVIVAMLLIVTIGFCILLCKRLKRLRADEDMLRQVVTDIVQSTGKAEHAIRTLKATAEECEHTLGIQLRDADSALNEIKANTSAAENVVQRLAEVVALAKTAKLFERPVYTMIPEPANNVTPEPSASPKREVRPRREEQMTREVQLTAAEKREVTALEALRARAA